MSFEWLRKQIQKRDDGVSPVVGTILMVAATVAIGATVFAALNAFGSGANPPPPTAVFSAKAVDSDADGLADKIRITYTAGADLDNSVVQVSVVNADTGATVSGPATPPVQWEAGQFRLYDPSAAGTFLVTITVHNSLVLDTTVVLAE